MSEVNRNIYKVPEGVDKSHDALTARLKILQPSLKELMQKALGLFDNTYDDAPHPSFDPNSPVYAVNSLNFCPVERVPMVRELTVVLGSGRWVRVFKSTESSPNTYARQQLWVWQPHEDLRRNISVKRTHDPKRVDFPYDIETIDYDDKGSCVGFVNGAIYFGQEPFIEEANQALDEAMGVAQEFGYY